MNAKLLIELTGVEAGSRECGPCDHRYWVGRTTKCRCDLFRQEDGRGYLLGGHFPHRLRCPACLDSELKPIDKTVGKLAEQYGVSFSIVHAIYERGWDDGYLEGLKKEEPCI